MNKLLQIIAVLVLTSLNIYAQREYSNWYFGQQAGVTFNTPNNEPVSMSGNILRQFEGCSSISTPQGLLRLYTNGQFVINGSGDILNIGEPLFGHQSSSQTSLIIPAPGNPTNYYIFTADAGEYTGEINRGINYSFVDMTLNGGKGGLVYKNLPLLPKACEQLSATYHANGEDIWIVARGWKNSNFYSFLLTKNGISDTVTTSIGFTRTTNNHTIGCLRFSPNSSIAVIPVYEGEFFEIYRFDNKSGIFDNRLQIDMPDDFTLYGAEFSSNGKVLYISSSKNPAGFLSIFQFNLSEYNKSKIESSKFLLAYMTGHIGTLQRGPNNKIYAAPINEPFLHSIENPNALGSNARFNARRVSLMDSLSQLGLPQSLNTPDNFRSFRICEGTDVVLETDEFLYDTIRYEATYRWDGPNGYESYEPKPKLINVNIQDSGDYVLTVTYIINGTPLITKYTLNVLVGERFTFSISGRDSICRGDFTTLIPDTLNNNFTYLWNTGRRLATLTANESGTYKLYIINDFGCMDSAVFKVTVVNAPESKILGDKLLCNNQSVVLSSAAQSNGLSYLWSTGETTSSISVSTAGIYKLKVTNSLGCSDSTSINVVSYPEMKVKIIGDSIWCSGTLPKLTALITPYDSSLTYKYKWSNDETTPVISINKTGKYQVIVTIENKCIFIDSVNVIKSDLPIISTDFNGQIDFCEGETLAVNLTRRDTLTDYFWSDGIKTFPRIIRQSGTYKIIAQNSVGCISEFEFSLNFREKPTAKIQISGDANLCTADSLTLSAYPKGENYRYIWMNNGETNDQLVIKSSGKYFLVVINENNCSDTTSINIVLGSGVPLNITGRTFACKGDTLNITASVNFMGNDDGISYLWSTGEKTKSIKVTSSGTYQVQVKHTSGCEGNDSINVRFFDVPDLSLNYTEPQTICFGDSIEVTAVDFNPDWNYSWDDGSSDLPRIFSKSGKFILYVVNAGTCKDSAIFELNIADLPSVSILADGDSIICINESLILSIADYSPSNSYLWSNGSIEQSVEISTPGTYYVTATNEFGCHSSDSITINRGANPKLVLSLSEPYLCNGKFLSVIANGDYAKLLWEDGSTGDEVLVSESGFYKAYALSKDGCIIEDSIEVNIFEDEVKVISPDINFDVLCPGDSQEIISEIENLSPFDITITNMSIAGDTQFSYESNLIGTALSSGSSKDFKVTFSPATIGKFESRIKIYFTHICPDSLELVLTGSSNYKSTLSLPGLKATSGERLCIPIYYDLDCVDTVNIITSFTIEIEFDGSYFLPETIETGKIIRNDLIDGIRYLTIKVDSLIFDSLKGVLTKICGTAMIGYDTLSPLKITKAISSEPIEVSTINGSIINELCLLDLRQIKHFKPTSLSILQNPVTDLMKVSVISEEKGIFALELINSAGITLFRDEWLRNEFDFTEKTLNISASNFPSGVYVLKLSSPWNIKSLIFVVIK